MQTRLDETAARWNLLSKLRDLCPHLTTERHCEHSTVAHVNTAPILSSVQQVIFNWVCRSNSSSMCHVCQKTTQNRSRQYRSTAKFRV